MQHEFINETETTFQIYQQVKTRAEAFYRFEFCNEAADDKVAKENIDQQRSDGK